MRHTAAAVRFFVWGALVLAVGCGRTVLAVDPPPEPLTDPPDDACADRDGDGFGASSCGGLDCDDLDALRSPGALEICDGSLDEDCDGRVDEGLTRGFYLDADGDGFGLAASTLRACAPPTERHVRRGGDCDDADRTVNPASAELCDGVDNDCDGAVDERGPREFYRDADGDGFGDVDDPLLSEECVPPTGFSSLGTDCDDRDRSIHPGAVERCDRVDSDCSVPGDEAGGLEAAEDLDEDGHAAPDAMCREGFPRDDCDDTRSAVFPGALERCDGVDNDCDGAVDEDMQRGCGLSGVCEAGACVERAGVAVGDDHACSILAHQTVCWGDNAWGQLGDGTTETRPFAVGVTSSARHVSLDAGEDHTCAVRSDGGVECWGRNDSQETGRSAPAAVSAPRRVPGVSDAVAVAVGSGFSCARLRGGEVQCWGVLPPRLLGPGVIRPASPPHLVPALFGSTQIAAGRDLLCGRSPEGTVQCRGRDGLGRLGRGLVAQASSDWVPLPFDGVRDVAVATDHTCVIDARERVWCLGGRREPIATLDQARVIDGLPFAPVRVRSGGYRSCVSGSAGGLVCFGSGTPQSIGTGFVLSERSGTSLDFRSSRDPVLGLETREFDVGRHASCASPSDDSGLVCWGRPPRLSTVLGVGLPSHPELAAIAAGAPLRALATSTAWTREGQTWVVGRSRLMPLPSNSIVPLPIAELGRSLALSEGSSACWILDGEAFCRGGSPVTFPVTFGPFSSGAPRVIVDPDGQRLGGLLEVSVAGEFACVLSDTGAVRCWGENDTGQLGRGFVSGIERTAAPVVALQSSGGLAARFGRACAIRSTGALACWGSHPAGLGRDGVYESSSPVDVGFSEAAVVGACLGRLHGCLLTNDGEVRCWGQDVLGDVAVEPEAVGVDDGVQLACGARSTCALRRGGQVSCWGSNFEGELGDGTSRDSVAPVDVLGLSDATELEAGDEHVCAQSASRGALCWGNDLQGQDGILLHRVVLPE